MKKGERKVNVEDLTSKLNQFISSHRGESFSGSDLCKQLTKLGFTPTIARNLQSSIFHFERIGQGRLYEIQKDQKPIFIGFVEGIFEKAAKKAMNSYYNKKNKATVAIEKTSSINEEDAWQVLIDKGLVKRIFDINKLKAKYPMIYLECLRYELVKP